MQKPWSGKVKSHVWGHIASRVVKSEFQPRTPNGYDHSSFHSTTLPSSPPPGKPQIGDGLKQKLHVPAVPYCKYTCGKEFTQGKELSFFWKHTTNPASALTTELHK